MSSLLYKNNDEMDIAKLMALYFSGLISKAEEEELRVRLQKHPADMELFQRLSSDSSFRERYVQQDRIDVKKAIRHFDRHTDRHLSWGRFRMRTAAAVVLLMLCSGGIFYVFQKRHHATPQIAERIIPGESKAILKLANNEIVYLSKEDIRLDRQDNIQVDCEKGELVYSGLQERKGEYNELILPKGGEYSLRLSDGTAIRLNSGSRLKYPVVFDGNTREVELEGEAFFDVASDSLHPFCVKVQDIVVKAYGTAFNINTYTAGHIRTALVKGRVGIRVKDEEKEYLMKPSQLADFDKDTKQVVVCDTDISAYIAWTNGYFMFINETLEQILHTLGLWYDFDVEFVDPDVCQLHFSGSMKRYEDITKILDAISYTVEVNIYQHGKTIIVEKK